MSEKKFEKTEKKDTPAKMEPASETFPVKSRINAYGFIFMRKKWLDALGWKKSMPLKIDRNPDGSITQAN